MKVTIKTMQLLNFKGVRKLTVNFGDITNISGDNGTGKTSIVDAFMWLLFGKNSADSKDFNIKTLDKQNQPLHKLEHQVTATLVVDEREITFSRLYKEKWTKKRGSAEEEFTGHETTYSVDDIPLKQEEFNSRVAFILNESVAKMITSPVYFNSLPWRDRRKVLEAMAGTISNEDIAAGNADFTNLLSKLGNTTLVEFKAKIGAQKKKIRETLDFLPAKIEEANHNMPQVEDYPAIEAKISTLNTEITGIDKAMEDKTGEYREQLQAINEKQNERHRLQNKLQEVKFNAAQGKKNEILEIEQQLRTVTNAIKTDEAEVENNNRAVSNNNLRINRLTAENDQLRKDWNTENARTFVLDEHALECPACKQKLPEGNAEEIRTKLTSNFNSDKANKLANITATGKNNGAEIEKLRSANLVFDNETLEIKLRIDEANKNLQTLYTKKNEVEQRLDVLPAEATLLEQQITKCIVPDAPVVDTTALKAQKQTKAAEIDILKERLASKNLIATIEKRIEQLQADEKIMSQQLADLEKMEFTIQEFSKVRIETIEARINGKFTLVKFKMFEQQINGGETECCECMIDGVPYADLNTASRINAGIDIINALTEHYKTSAPVFIDNRESVIQILSCKSQIVNLRAVEKRPLTIEAGERMLAAA